MLRNLRKTDTRTDEVAVKEINTTLPFYDGLNYSAPARGTWTIAHTSMLIPHCHQIFVCPQACLRGVVLSAEEYGGLDRFSMVTVAEEDFSSGEMEPIFIEGVTEIIRSLPEKPPAVLVYSSCVQHFTGCDMAYVFKTLRERFPDIDILECFMYPTMRKSKYPPDELMRIQLYSALEMTGKDPKAVNIIGNDFAFDEGNEILSMLRAGGYTVRDLPRMTEYAEYKQMAESAANLYVWPNAEPGAKALEKRLGQKAVSLPVSYDYEEIKEELKMAASLFSLPLPDLDILQEQAEKALQDAKEAVGCMPVEIDYTATSRPFGLAALLLSHGFDVRAVYTDAVNPADEKALDYLKRHAPDLPVRATIHFRSRLRPRTEALETGGNVLAIGQKAAYFAGTPYFVNMIQHNGLWGFNGIVRLADLMREAALVKKDTKAVISVKGWGCCG